MPDAVIRLPMDETLKALDKRDRTLNDKIPDAPAKRESKIMEKNPEIIRYEGMKAKREQLSKQLSDAAAKEDDLIKKAKVKKMPEVLAKIDPVLPQMQVTLDALKTKELSENLILPTTSKEIERALQAAGLKDSKNVKVFKEAVTKDGPDGTKVETFSYRLTDADNKLLAAVSGQRVKKDDKELSFKYLTTKFDGTSTFQSYEDDTFKDYVNVRSSGYYISVDRPTVVLPNGLATASSEETINDEALLLALDGQDGVDAKAIMDNRKALKEADKEIREFENTNQSLIKEEELRVLQPFADQMDKVLGFSEKFGSKPRITRNGKGEEVIEFTLGTETNPAPEFLPAQMSRDINAAIKANEATTGIRQNDFESSFDSKKQTISFPVREIQQSGMKPEEFFAKLASANNPPLKTTVATLADTVASLEVGKTERYAEYKKRLAKTMGVDESKLRLEGSKLYVDTSTKEEADKLSNELAKIRNEAMKSAYGLDPRAAREALPVLYENNDTKYGFDLTDIDIFDRKPPAAGQTKIPFLDAMDAQVKAGKAPDPKDVNPPPPKPEAESDVAKKERIDGYAKQLERTLGIGKEFGVDPVVRTVQKNGKSETYIVYYLGPDAIAQGFGAKPVDPKLPKQIGLAIDAALEKTNPTTGLNGDSLIYAYSEDKPEPGRIVDTLIAFPVSEIEKRDKGGTYFDDLAKAKPELLAAVKDVATESKRPEMEKQKRVDEYAKRLTQIMGTSVAEPKARFLGDAPHLQMDLGSKDKNDKFINLFVPIRNDALIPEGQDKALGPKLFPLGLSTDGKIMFSIEAIEAYDKANGAGAFFQKLDTEVNRQKIKAVVGEVSAVPAVPAPPKSADDKKVLEEKYYKYFNQIMDVTGWESGMRDGATGFIRTKEGVKADDIVAKLAPVMDKEFAGMKLFDVVEENPYANKIIRSVKVNFEAVDAYEKANGAGSFEKKLVEVKPAMLKALAGPVPAAPVQPKPPEPSADEKAAKQKRYEAMAEDLAVTSGIKAKFGDNAKVVIDDYGIRVDLNKAALATLPAGAPSDAASMLASTLSDKLVKIDPKLLASFRSSGWDGTKADFTLPFASGVTPDQAMAAIEKLKALPSPQADIIKESEDKIKLEARSDLESKYAALFSRALGGSGYSIMATTEGATGKHTVDAKLYLSAGQNPEAMLAKLQPIFDEKFGAGSSFLKVVDVKTIPPSRTLSIDLEAAVAYDQKNGPGAFKKAIDSMQPKINQALGIKVTPEPDVKPDGKPVVTPEPEKPKNFLDMLADNMGMGIGGLLGAIIGWFVGGPIGVAVGALLVGGAGAYFVDGKNGVLGLGGESATMTPKLKTAVTDYAKLRFTDLENGTVNQAKVDEFVKRYESMVAKNMKPEDQDKRADEIVAKTTAIKTNIRDALADAPNMEKAMNQARTLMQELDAGVVQPTDAAALTSLAFSPAKVQKLADSIRR